MTSVRAKAEFDLTARATVPSFGGYGVQFNQHVYARVTGLAPERLGDLEEKVVALSPQLVRLFYNERQEGGPAHARETATQKDNWASFVRAARLAQRAGAAVNVTWQSGRLATAGEREASMTTFAEVLRRLVVQHEVGDLRWATVQNEPNTPPSQGRAKTVTPERIAELYAILDRRLTERGIRDQIRFMGGDLIEGSRDPRSPLSQRRWLEHMSAHLAGLLDAYSVHVYWDYDDTARFERRLADVRRIVDRLPNRKPLFVTEYGTRSKDRRKEGVVDPGTFHGAPLCTTNLAAFQAAWFQIRAAQLGYAGAVKWDCYFGRYDRGRQAYYAIGAPGSDGWQLYPMYFLLRLFTLTTERGWRVLAVERGRSPGETRQLAAFAGLAGELTVLGLDTRGSGLNGTSSTIVPFTIGGLPPRTRLELVLWNRAGGGKLTLGRAVTTDAAGVAALEIPLHSVFALTTKRLATL
jgi:hypothetical protein